MLSNHIYWIPYNLYTVINAFHDKSIDFEWSEWPYFYDHLILEIMIIILIIDKKLCGYLHFETLKQFYEDRYIIAHKSKRHSTKQPNSEKMPVQKLIPI